MGKYIIPVITAISLLLNIFFGYKAWETRNNAERGTKNVEQKMDDAVETPRRDVSTNTIDKSTSHTVQRIIDGDTFDIESGERIRLYGINAPEYPKGCMGEDAKQRLEDLILSKQVNIENVTKDNFGRQVSLVYVGELLVNELLVEEGSAYFEKAKPEREESLLLEKAEQKAQQTERGVWSALCETKQDGCTIKGNYREADHTRIYHTSDCYNYDRITVKPGTSDRWFCTEEEAKKAGFRKSLDCPNI